MGTKSVIVARLVYLLICELAGVLIALSTTSNQEFSINLYQGLAGGLVVASFFILVESLMKGFSLRGFSTATFGILVGLLCAWLLTAVGIDDLLVAAFGRDTEVAEAASLVSNVTIFGALGFLGAALALRSAREDFAFIVPYVRFRSESLGGRPVVLDVSSIIDGRITKLVKTGFLPSNLVIPHFVLERLRAMTDSQSEEERVLAKRALRNLDELKALSNVELNIHDSHGVGEEDPLEDRLVQIVRLLGGRLLTLREETVQVARLQRVEVLNICELMDALRQDVSVGQKVRVALIRQGKDESQAVGFLDDGTMIVVNNAVRKIGSTQNVSIISSLETASGTMFFAELV